MNTPGPSPEPGPGEIRWTEDAEARVARAPVFLRGMVRRLAEKRARAEGVRLITPELMSRYKSEMMGLAATGAYQVPQSAPPWTPGALELLDAVPSFMRPMTRRICEELAAEHGAVAVSPALIREAEAEAETEAAAAPLPWSLAAEARLVARLGKARCAEQMGDIQSAIASYRDYLKDDPEAAVTVKLADLEAKAGAQPSVK